MFLFLRYLMFPNGYFVEQMWTAASKTQAKFGKLLILANY